MIALSAVVAGWESIRRLVDPRPSPTWAGSLAAGLIGFAGNELVAVYRIRVGRGSARPPWSPTACTRAPTGSPRSRSSLGAGGRRAGFPLADPIVGLLITVAILPCCARRRATSTGGSWTPSTRSSSTRPRQRCSRRRESRGVGSCGCAGSDTASAPRPGWSVDPRPVSLAEAHGIAHEAQHRLLHDVPKLADATVHVSPSNQDGRVAHDSVAHHGIQAGAGS